MEGTNMTRRVIIALSLVLMTGSVLCLGAGQAAQPGTKLPPIEDLAQGKFVKPPPSPAPVSYLNALSMKGDYIGQGKTLKFQGDQLKVKKTDRGVSLNIGPWSAWFGAPKGQFLRVGEYRNAKRHAFSKDAPGIDFSGEGRGCNMIAGEFVVWELEVKDNQITKLAIDFVQRCEGKMPPLIGRIRINSSLQ
jgi:hypothetical protein